MFIVIAYDVSTQDKAGATRLRRVARTCQDYGQRVQNSVFECKLDKQHWVVLRDKLLKIIDQKQDSLRIYFLDKDVQIEHIGCKKPIDFEEPLVF
ncbi:MAG: CRISPR-associated endonuclease Cas2 [Blastocatellia bacterium]|nr:CRISPR-associated endonuclease Cas2 [Blastocatellia bacterium]